MLLGIAVLAAWMRVPAAPGWRLAFWFHVLLFVGLALFAHPVLQPQRLATWWPCLTEGSTSRLRKELALTPQQGVLGGASDWDDLDRVAVFLREQAIEAGDFVCLHEATMPLYLEMDAIPSVRYLFYGQATSIYRGHRKEVMEALAATRAHYVVSDLAMVGWQPDETRDRARWDPQLPLPLPASLADSFPWSEPVVFRAGRYVVHRLSKPIEKI